MPVDERIVKRFEDLKRHKKNVIDAAELLSDRIIERATSLDEVNFAIQLVEYAYRHDCSKFYGIEWECLHRDVDEETRNMAWKQHVMTNNHHPEYWGGIEQMPRIALASMVCDWKARSEEMGTSLRDWFKEEAVPKYKLKPQSRAYKEIKYYLDLILDPTFR